MDIIRDAGIAVSYSLHQVVEFFTTYTWLDVIKAPYYIYMAALHVALYLHEYMKDPKVWLFSIPIVFIMVKTGTLITDMESRQTGTLTMYNVYSEKRLRYRVLKSLALAALAPIYPIYFWAVKGTAFLVGAYFAPYYILMRIMAPQHMVQGPERLTAEQRYERIQD